MSDLAIHEDEALAPIVVQPLTLFGTTDPVEVLARATRTANALARVINDQGLFAMIANRKYVTVEGWTLLGSMVGVFPKIEWTRRLEDGFEARAVAMVASTGAIIGAGEAQCTRSETTWKGRDEYALRGMAQTRAISRALRGPLDFIVRLAGYASTPAEEMPRDVEPRSRPRHRIPQGERSEEAATTKETSAKAPPGGSGGQIASSAMTLAEPSGEVGDMAVLYHLGGTLPKKAATREQVDYEVAQHGYQRVLMRLKSKHALDCGTAKCEHVVVKAANG